MPKEDVARIINSLHFSCKIIAHEGLPEKVSRDPKDDPLLADATQAGVDYIITGDKDLLVLACYKNIPIVAPGLLPKIDSAFDE